MDEERGRFSGARRDVQAKQAAVWFARWQAGSVDADEFERWRDADPAHALAFARVTNAWEIAAEIAEPATTASIVTRRRVIGGSIAGAVLAAGATALFATRAYARESATTAIGETRKLRLSDGSMIALNTDTALSWRFTAAARELWLERGEVALDLTAGPEARLRAADAQAALSGGRFNARLRRTQLDLTVLRGTATTGTATPLKVQPYQRASFADAEPSVQPLSSDAAEVALAWQSGDVVFHDTPLSEAVAEYNRYLLRKIVIDVSELGALRVGGRFASSDPADFLGAVATGFGVRVRSSATGYHLTR